MTSHNRDQPQWKLSPASLELAEDMRHALATGAIGVPVESPSQFNLGGLYNFRTSGPVVEIELVELQNLRRSLIYAQAIPSFLVLPIGTYKLCYRLVSGDVTNEFSLQCIRLSFLKRANLYFRKALSLGLDLRRWASAWRSRRVSRTRAVGVRLISQNRAHPITHSTRPLMAPVPVPESTCVSIIIPTKTRHDLLSDCLRSLKRIEGVNFEIIIVDNGATDPLMLSRLRAFSREADCRVLRHDIPFNFSKLCNLGAMQARFPLLLFLNDDIEALDGLWLKSMCGFILRGDVGVVGARLLYPSRDLQHGGIATHFVPGPGHPWRHLKENEWRANLILSTPGEVDAVTGACLLIRADIFDQIGRFDEDRFAVTINDVDICLRARRHGLKVVYDPGATLLHKEGQSRPDDEREDQKERHAAELRAYLELYPDYARSSVFYPVELRRDTETAAPIL